LESQYLISKLLYFYAAVESKGPLFSDSLRKTSFSWTKNVLPTAWFHIEKKNLPRPFRAAGSIFLWSAPGGFPDGEQRNKSIQGG
jgi:hypothetical protein